ncbi:MAG: hypothetical protein ABR583_13055 [Gaiellaceae bacterium]
MAEAKDLLGRLTDAGEDAISKVSEMPGASRVTNAFGAMRDRMDELQRRVRGLEEIEQRLAKLEKRVDELGKTPPSRSSSGAKRSAAAKKSPPKRPPS